VDSTVYNLKGGPKESLDQDTPAWREKPLALATRSRTGSGLSSGRMVASSMTNSSFNSPGANLLAHVAHEYLLPLQGLQDFKKGHIERFA